MKFRRQINSAKTDITLEGLLGQHPRIKERKLELQLDEFLDRLQQHQHTKVPAYQQYRQLRQDIIEREREQLNLQAFKPRPLASFVRNKLINQVYLPMIGDNLAKQMGTVGDSKRTDLSGMLLLISPPGYGKTTLLEYIAQRLGLVFMKINCPTLGHNVVSVDPQEAPNATARQELHKLNLALEMGNNVMLYLDDIQHSNPEFLQKFISLADGQRKIEGVWRGRSQTYDLRGKRFCIAMAGNPYTESGEAFKIPDMLANRADIYNLGDVLSGREAVFALSYIENSLTSNPALAPLANREAEDIYRFIRLAQGEEVASSEFSHSYSSADINEIISVLKKLFKVQEVLLKVNQQYIASAAQADHYRTEPPFKLQGSYRNMNKLAEKIVAVMNEKELQDLISDHYQGEAQTLTQGAEENLLKLKELRGILSPEEQARWNTIKAEFARRQSLGGEEDDAAQRLINQVSLMATHLDKLQKILTQSVTLWAKQHTAQSKHSEVAKVLLPSLDSLNQHVNSIAQALLQASKGTNNSEDLSKVLEKLGSAVEKIQPQIEIINQMPDSLGNTIEQLVGMIDSTLLPLVHDLERKSRMDLVLWNRLKDVSGTLKELHKEVFIQGRHIRQANQKPLN